MHFSPFFLTHPFNKWHFFPVFPPPKKYSFFPLFFLTLPFNKWQYFLVFQIFFIFSLYFKIHFFQKKHTFMFFFPLKTHFFQKMQLSPHLYSHQVAFPPPKKKSIFFWSLPFNKWHFFPVFQFFLTLHCKNLVLLSLKLGWNLTMKVATKSPISVPKFRPDLDAIHFRLSRACLILGFWSKGQRFNSPQFQHYDFHHGNLLCFRSWCQCLQIKKTRCLESGWVKLFYQNYETTLGHTV